MANEASTMAHNIHTGSTPMTTHPLPTIAAGSTSRFTVLIERVLQTVTGLLRPGAGCMLRTAG